MKNSVLEIYTDGASRGNPGDAAWAFVFVVDGEVVEQRSAGIGTATNNVAEYHAVINALLGALGSGWRRAVLSSDSELVVRQITGRYRVRKAHLAPLLKEVLTLRDRFEEISFRSVTRSNPFISRADHLCNRVLDRESRRTKEF
jgi:ribonuclease HI